MAEEVTVPFGESELAGLWDAADGDPFAVAVLAHGAGNEMRHRYMERVALGLVARGMSALRFNFPYKSAGRGYPDPPRVLLPAWRAALTEAVRRGGGLPVVASGKSLGGRMASVVAAEDGPEFPGRALVFLGYPLHAPGKADKPRDSHLDQITVPMLFVQGARDPFASFDLIQQVVARLGSRARSHVVEGGDHSHKVKGRGEAEVLDEIARAFVSFVREVVG